MTYVSEDADGWHSLKKVFARASDIPKAEVDEGVLSDMLRDARFKEGDVIESINPKQKAALPAVSPEEAELERVIRSRAHVEALMESCSHIAQNPIGEFEAELKRRNVQGEFPIALLTLLVVQSSHLKKPLSGIVRGQSSSGKSFVSGTVVDLVPDEFKVVYTSGSAKSLIYEPEGFFRHKTLVLMEAESMVRQNGTEENQFAEMMRVLISENRLLYRTVDRNPATQMLETMEKVQEGPIGLLTTTVRDSIDPETETRMIPAYSDESVEQTKAIVQSIGAAASGRVKVVKNNLPWHDFARWLRFGPQDAVIPFGEIISDSVSYEAVRARRDITSIFACIKASALIHRLTREVNDDGLLVAELEDYAVAHRVLEASLKPRGHLTTAEEDLWVSLLSRLVKKEWFDAEVPWEKDDKYLPPLVQYVDAQAEWKVAGAPRYCPMTDMPTGFDEQYSHTPTEKQDFFAKCIVGQREVVAKELGISESTLYRGLKSLQTKGLVGQSFVKGTGGRIIVWIAENAQLSLEDTDEILPSPAALEAEWSALMENTNEDA